MRLAKLYVRTAVLALLAVAVCACHTAQKPVSLLPPAKAPSLKPTAPPVQVPTTAAASSPAQVEDNSSQKSDRTESAPASAAASISNSDPVADLIARAEKEYQAGLANHQAGKTEEAKQNFDNALNALLSSNLDIRSDERLQEEFDRVVAGVNQLYPGGPGADTEARPLEDGTACQRVIGWKRVLGHGVLQFVVPFEGRRECTLPVSSR